MKNIRVSIRYAKSIFVLAQEQKSVDKVYDDMKLISSTCEEVKDLTLVLRSPLVKSDAKGDVLAKIFKGKVQDITLKFMHILTEKGREILLPNIARSFIDLYKTKNNIATAQITSAFEMDKGLRDRILSSVKSGDIEQVELIEEVDEAIIGGLIIRLGDKQLDASIARRFNDLKKEFKKNPYISEL